MRKHILLITISLVLLSLLAACSKEKPIDTSQDRSLGEDEDKLQEDLPEEDKQEQVSPVIDDSNEDDEAEDSEDESQEEAKEEDKDDEDDGKVVVVSEEIDPSVNNFQAGQRVNLPVDSYVYSNIDLAEKGNTSDTKYSKGNYIIYKVSGQYINISKTKGEAGGWLHHNKVTANPVKNDEVVEEYSDPNNYSWSWAYPDSTGKNLLESYNGLYKAYTDKDIIYLTFDNGYEYQNLTPVILDILSRNSVPGHFFVTSSYMKNNPGIVKRMVREGHIVGNHTQNHLNHNDASDQAIEEDLSMWEKDYRSLIGEDPATKLFRPPEGKFNERSLKIARKLGYRTILWSYAYNDWDIENQPGVNESLTKLIKNTDPGEIVLLHAISQTNVDLLDDYIKHMKAEGYEFRLLTN